MLAEGLAGVLVNKVPAVRDGFVFMLHVYRVLYSIAASTDIMAAYSPATSQGIGTSHSLHAPSASTAR